MTPLELHFQILSPSLASLAVTLPVTTATVERSFSDMKLIKTHLRNRFGEESLDQAMHICIEGLDTLNSDDLKDIVTHWKEQKPRRLILQQYTSHNVSVIVICHFLYQKFSLSLPFFPSLFTCPPPPPPPPPALDKTLVVSFTTMEHYIM